MKNDRYLLPWHSSIIAREGWVFIFLFGFLSALFLLIGVLFIGVPLLFLTLFTIYFFRNPERVLPEGEDLIVSPADGRIIEVSDVQDNVYTGRPAKKVSIFMSVFSVHVNRVPVGGKVEDIRYHPGKFVVASLDKASEDNERNAVILNAGKSAPIAVVQIAGLIARRIVCYLSIGDRIDQGERFGLIRFGSRVDLYLPLESRIEVGQGDKVRAGSTIIGRFE